jgi:hypothetical protein
MITVDLVTFLHNHPGLVGLIGTRLFPVRLPQGIGLPAGTYLRVDAPVGMTQQGGEVARPRYQFDFYAGSYLEVEAVAVAFLDAVGDWREGRRDPAMVSGPYDAPEPPELNRYRMTVDVVFWE